MAAIALDTLREGVSLLGGVFREVDALGNSNGRINKKEVQGFIDIYGDMNDSALGDALKKVHAYARKRNDTTSPTVAQVNSALGQAMRALAKADKDDSDTLSTSEQKGLAKTWKAVASFAEAFEGMSIDQLTTLSE